MDLLTGDPIEPSPPTPSSKSLPDNEGLQHDLEKLQAAHDGLLHELAEKKTFCERLHEQLDRLVEENNDLRAQLEGNEKENERLNQEIRNRDTTIEELKENETKNQKLKQLAVKLKKELAEVKEEVSDDLLTSSNILTFISIVVGQEKFSRKSRGKGAVEDT